MDFEELEKNRIRPYIELVSIEYMQNIIKQNKLKHVLEIGTCHGYSALKFGAVVESVTTIEKDKANIKIANENIKKYKATNIKILEGDAITILKQLQNKKQTFDLILIDAMKKEYKDYLELSLQLIKKGFIYADNTISHKEKLKDFFEYLKESNLNWKETNLGKGLIEIRV